MMLRDPQGPPSMAKIAALAGVSASTVSRALVNHPRISKETCERIRKLARDVDYRINPAVACSLSRARLGKPSLIGATLAYLEDFNSWNEVTEHEKTRRIIRLREGVMQRAQEVGYGIDHLLIGGPKTSPARVSDILEARGIQGIILAPSPEPHRSLQLNWNKFAIVALGETLEDPPVNRVSIDHFGNLYIILRHLRDHGYRRVGFVLDALQNERNGCLPYSAFRYFQETNPQIGSLPIFSGKDENACLRWLKKTRPDVVISYDPRLIFKLDEWGYAIPKDIGFVTLERPGMEIDAASADENSNMAGATAVDLVISAIHANDFGPPVTPKITLVQGGWIDGPTLRECTPKPQDNFARADIVPTQSFVPVNLLPFCNRRILSKECFLGNWRGHGLPIASCVPPGSHRFRGVPFEIAAAPQARSEPVGLVMASRVMAQITSRTFPREVRLPVNRRVEAIYFLHGCGWVIGHRRVAQYSLCHADGDTSGLDIVSFYKRPVGATACAIRKKESSVQDHSVYWEQFENDHAKPATISRGKHAWSYKVYFYVYEWINPRPSEEVREIVITTDPDQVSTFAVLGISLLPTAS